MKGVAAVATATAREYSPYAVYEDQRTRFKHQSLMQDFEDLHTVITFADYLDLQLLVRFH